MQNSIFASTEERRSIIIIDYEDFHHVHYGLVCGFFFHGCGLWSPSRALLSVVEPLAPFFIASAAMILSMYVRRRWCSILCSVGGVGIWSVAMEVGFSLGVMVYSLFSFFTINPTNLNGLL
jgi:hypothetical protein